MPRNSVKNSLSGKRRPHTSKIILYTKKIILTIIIMQFKPIIFVTALLLQDRINVDSTSQLIIEINE